MKKQNTLLISVLQVLLLASLVAPEKAHAGFMDYMSGCVLGLGSGLAGTAFANTNTEEGDRINTAGYAIAGSLGCLAGMAYVGIVGSQAEFKATYRLKEENDTLVFQRNRLAKERCLLKDACEPGGSAIIVERETEIKKQGDKVFRTQTSTIEANQ